MMAFVGFVMITANGFAAVLMTTGHVEKPCGRICLVIGRQCECCGVNHVAHWIHR